METISADEFFIAVVAALQKGGHRVVDINTDLDRAFERIYNQLRVRLDAEGVQLSFRIRTHPNYGDSEFLRELIDTGSKNNVVDVANPTFKRMAPKLNGEQSDYFLTQLPVEKDWFLKLVQSQFDSATQRALPVDAA